MVQSSLTKELIHKDTGDGLIIILPWAYHSITQGTFAYSASTAEYFNGGYYNSTNAEGDQIDYKVWLSKGVWQLSLGFCNSYVYSAMYLILLDSVLQGQIDPYDCRGMYWGGMNGPLYVPSTGIHTLSLKAWRGIAGNDYRYMYFNSIVLDRREA